MARIHKMDEKLESISIVFGKTLKNLLLIAFTVGEFFNIRLCEDQATSERSCDWMPTDR